MNEYECVVCSELKEQHAQILEIEVSMYILGTSDHSWESTHQLAGGVLIYTVLCSFFYTVTWVQRTKLWCQEKHLFMKCHTHYLGNGVACLWFSRPPQRVCCQWPWGGALSTFMSVGGATFLSFPQVMSRWRDSSARSPPITLPNTLQLFMDWVSDFQACGMIEFQTEEVPRGANTLNILQVERLKHK